MAVGELDEAGLVHERFDQLAVDDGETEARRQRAAVPRDEQQVAVVLEEEDRGLGDGGGEVEEVLEHSIGLIPVIGPRHARVDESRVGLRAVRPRERRAPDAGEAERPDQVGVAEDAREWPAAGLASAGSFSWRRRRAHPHLVDDLPPKRAHLPRTPQFASTCFARTPIRRGSGGLRALFRSRRIGSESWTRPRLRGNDAWRGPPGRRPSLRWSRCCGTTAGG